MAGKEIRTPDGTLVITEDAVAAVAAAACQECPGVATMAARGIQEGLADILGHQSPTRGVDVEVGADGARIGLDIVVAYGVRIGDVAATVADRVRRAVEELAGVPVARIEVRVQGVRPTRGRGGAAQERADGPPPEGSA
jgi:uncharacterized alkaline shock family protein YloU